MATVAWFGEISCKMVPVGVPVGSIGVRFRCFGVCGFQSMVFDDFLQVGAGL